jgi:hypothetical protein
MLYYNKLLLVIIIQVIFSACNRLSTEKQENRIENGIEIIAKGNISFADDILNVPMLNLPYTIYCGLDDGLPWAEDIVGLDVSEFLPENTIMAGRLPINNDNVYIVYGLPGDIIYPYLNIYNKTGEKIDSLYLHIGYCTGDDSEIVTNITTINKDFSISMVDTTKFIHYSDENEIIIDSIILKKNDLKLISNGLYKNQNKESIRIQ